MQDNYWNCRKYKNCKKIHSVNIALEGSTRRIAVVNNLGISCFQKDTTMEVKVFITSKNGIDTASGYEANI